LNEPTGELRQFTAGEEEVAKYLYAKIKQGYKVFFYGSRDKKPLVNLLAKHIGLPKSRVEKSFVNVLYVVQANVAVRSNSYSLANVYLILRPDLREKVERYEKYVEEENGCLKDLYNYAIKFTDSEKF